ncbi:MAG TPA: glycosyltransferase family 39 protein [Candidatus Nanoarchaeia archaeon]|nr:glycosyltransferase family 39 protein [Candidatus Nanoarchaeia archaeon]
MKHLKRTDKKIWILFLLALLLRLIPALWLSSPPTDDAQNYHEIALNVAHGEGFSWQGKLTAFREPLLPYLSGLIYSVFGEDPRWVYAFQSILSALTVVFVFYLSHSLLKNDKAAWFAAIVTAVYPNFILYSQFFLTETLTMFLLIFFVWTLVKALQTKQNKRFILAGVLLGLLILTKAAFLFFIPFLILYFIIFYWRQWKLPFVKGLALLLVFSLLLVGIWTIRNYTIFHELIPVVNRGGTALFYGVYIPYNNMYVYDGQYDPVEKEIMGDEKDPARLDARFYQAAKNYVLEHPIASFFFYLKKMAIMWYGPADAIGYPLIWFTGSAQILYEKPILEAVFSDARATLTIFIYVGLYWVVLLLAIYALWQKRKNKNVWLLLWPVIYGTLFYAIVLVTARYKEPFLPFMFILAGYGWVKQSDIIQKIGLLLHSKKGN